MNQVASSREWAKSICRQSWTPMVPTPSDIFIRGKLPEHAAAFLHNDVLPQNEKWGLAVKAVLTDNGREYCGKEHHPYELYLALNDIQHRTTKVKSPQTNRFVERFNRTVLDEFFFNCSITDLGNI